MKKRLIVMAGVMVLAAMVAMAATKKETKAARNAEAATTASKQVTETRKHTGFEKIEINGSPKVVYTQGKAFSVKLTGRQEDIDNIVTEVKGRKLTVRNRGKVGIFNFSFSRSEQVVIYVTSPDLTGIRLNGSGDFISQQRVDTDNLDIVLRGSGDIDFKDIICDHCATDLTGSGDIDIERLEAISSTVKLVGSGDVKIRQYLVDNTAIALTGSGDITVDFVNGCKKADCQLTGSGDIRLRGKVRQLTKQKRGSGDIHTDKLTIEK